MAGETSLDEAVGPPNTVVCSVQLYQGEAVCDRRIGTEGFRLPRPRARLVSSPDYKDSLGTRLAAGVRVHAYLPASP